MSSPEQLTNRAGVVVFEGTAAPGGGSQSLKVVRVPIAFDTPDIILTGIVVYTPTPGDLLLAAVSTVDLTTPWDAPIDNPFLYFFPQGHAPTDSGVRVDLATANDTSTWPSGDDVDNPFSVVGGQQISVNSMGFAVAVFRTATPLLAAVSTQTGTDPGSMQGEGAITLLMVPATP